MKSNIMIALLLLVAWMGGSQYVWLCGVKKHCSSDEPGSVAVEPSTSSPPATAREPMTAPAESSGSMLSAQTDGASVPQTPPQTSDATDGPEDFPDAQPQIVAQAPEPPPPAGQTPLGRSLVVVVDGKRVLASDQAIQFERDSWQLSAADTLLYDLVGWMTNHGAVELTVTGEYLEEEINRSDWSNLGLARAHELIDQLAQLGARRRNLQAAAQLIEQPPAGLQVVGTDYSELFTSQQFYFPSSSTQLAATDSLRQFAELAQSYMAHHPAAVVRITGHTDNSGSPQSNFALGLARAREVATLLRSLGLPDSRLQVQSAGQSQPVAPNDSDANKARNRRVELTLTSI